MSGEPSGKISLTLGGAKKPPKPAPTNGVKRSHAALHDHEDEATKFGETQTVSHFDRSAGGAVDEAQPKKDEGPLVIASQANRDWKEASRRNKRQRSGRPGEMERGVQNGAMNGVDKVEEAKTTYGLNVFKRAATGDDVLPNGHSTAEDAMDTQPTPAEANGEPSTNPKTDDERAVEALLGQPEKTDLILPAITEDEAFTRDYASAPSMATLADYDRVPVEQFGAALLRGMGWKEGDGIGSQRGKKMEKTKLPERRPALLGIGAKEEAAVAQEMGTWGRAAKDRKAKEVVYNPVLLRDKKTGELFTEGELEQRKKIEERERYEMEFEREEKQRRREKERDEGKREKSGRRERSRERDRRKEEESDEEYYRRKEKEKRRRERERGDSDYDSHRSSRHGSDRERHKDRHRERHR